MGTVLNMIINWISETHISSRIAYFNYLLKHIYFQYITIIWINLSVQPFCGVESHFYQYADFFFMNYSLESDGKAYWLLVSTVDWYIINVKKKNTEKKSEITENAWHLDKHILNGLPLLRHWSLGGLLQRPFASCSRFDDIHVRAKQGHQLLFVCGDVPFHDLHARPQKPFKGLHIHG